MELFRIHGAHPSISALTMSFAEDDRIWKNEQLEPLVKGDYLYRCHEIKQRIDSRTMGLLELNNYHKYADYELK